MVISIPITNLLAPDEDKDWGNSESYFEREWEHNEEETLAKLPADLKEDLLKIKNIDLEEYGDLLHDAAHSQYDEHFDYMEAFEKVRFETDMMVQKLEL
jgi:hypothetical protein